VALSLDDELAPVLDHVQVAAPAGCEEPARRFYGELLGLAEVEKPEGLRARGGVWFALGGGSQLHVGVAADFAPARKAHPGLRVGTVARLERLGQRLEAAGVPVQWDSELSGVQRFFTADPFGNRLELLAAAAGSTTGFRTWPGWGAAIRGRGR
jgi:catechol 2,3-dioxygenase-like lactoylglutathione lyase family enzyme